MLHTIIQSVIRNIRHNTKLILRQQYEGYTHTIQTHTKQIAKHSTTHNTKHTTQHDTQHNTK